MSALFVVSANKGRREKFKLDVYNFEPHILPKAPTQSVQTSWTWGEAVAELAWCLYSIASMLQPFSRLGASHSSRCHLVLYTPSRVLAPSVSIQLIRLLFIIADCYQLWIWLKLWWKVVALLAITSLVYISSRRPLPPRCRTLLHRTQLRPPAPRRLAIQLNWPLFVITDCQEL